MSANLAARRKDASAEAEEYAASVFAQRPKLDRLPIPVYAIARAHRLRVVDAVLQSGTDGVLASQGVILLSHAMGGVRARFTVAHELAHAAFDTGCGDGSVAEMEADAFAGGLLMPPCRVSAWMDDRFMVQKRLPISGWAAEEARFRTITCLRHDFGVSLDTALQTLQDVGCIADLAAWTVVHRASGLYRAALVRGHARSAAGPRRVG